MNKCIRKSALYDNLGSNMGPSYIKKRVLKRHVIKRLRCINFLCVEKIGMLQKTSETLKTGTCIPMLRLK